MSDKNVVICSSCNGTGRVLTEGKSAPDTCTKCGGTGKVVTRTEGRSIRESKYLTE